MDIGFDKWLLEKDKNFFKIGFKYRRINYCSICLLMAESPTVECDFHQTLLSWTWKVLARLVFINQHSLQGQKCPILTIITQFQMYTNLTYLWVLMREITLVVTSQCKKHLLYFLRLDRIKWLNFCSSETVDQSLSIQNFRSYPLMPKPNLHGKQK